MAFGDQRTAGTDEHRSAGEHLIDSGVRDRTEIVARYSKQPVLRAAGLNNGTCPVRPCFSGARRRVGGKGKESNFATLHAQKTRGLGQESVETDVRSDAAQRSVDDLWNASAVVDLHLKHRNVHLAPVGVQVAFADEDKGIEENIAGVFEQTGGYEDTGIGGDARKLAEGWSVERFRCLPCTAEYVAQPLRVIAAGMVRNEPRDAELGEDHEIGAVFRRLARPAPDVLQIGGGAPRRAVDGNGGNADLILHFCVVPCSHTRFAAGSHRGVQLWYIQIFEYTRINMTQALRQFKADVFQGLAHPTRIAIVDALRDGELTAGKLIEQLDLEQANASQHLAVLRARRIVRNRKAGNQVYYSLRDPIILELLDILRRYFYTHRSEMLSLLEDMDAEEVAEQS